MTNEQNIIETIGATYCAVLTEQLEALDAEARAYVAGILFSSLVTVLISQRGPGDVAAFLRRTIERIEQEAAHGVH